MNENVFNLENYSKLADYCKSETGNEYCVIVYTTHIEECYDIMEENLLPEDEDTYNIKYTTNDNKHSSKREESSREDI